MTPITTTSPASELPAKDLIVVAPSLSPSEQKKQLAKHEKNIRTFIRGAMKGAAELYGYAYLAGREMLIAKDLLPHGNENPDACLTKWLEEKFPSVTDRTCRRWMQYARDVNERAPQLSQYLKTPLQLSGGKLTKQGHEAILEVIPQLMDGKTMTSFMRDSRLAREPERQTHTPPRDLTPDEKVAAELAALENHINKAMEYMTIVIELNPTDAAKIMPARWEALLNVCMRLSPLARELSKAPKSKKN